MRRYKNTQKMTASTRHMRQKAFQYFILLILCFILFVTSSIAWHKQYKINQYTPTHAQNAPTIPWDSIPWSSSIRNYFEENEIFLFYYTLGTKILDHPLMHMLGAYLAYGITKGGYRWLKGWYVRLFKNSNSLSPLAK